MPPRTADHDRLPPQRRGSIGRPGQQEHTAGADEEHRGGQVGPARDQPEHVVDARQRLRWYTSWCLARHGSGQVPEQFCFASRLAGEPAFFEDDSQETEPDFVALISQEHETIVAFINEGGGRFRKQTLYSAPHPGWGSSGIQLVDLNGDAGGKGFTLHAAEGDTVAAGDAVVSWTPADVEAGGRSPMCPVVALEGKPEAVIGLVAPGTAVRAGEPLFVWA
jgi:hypothetical protein